MMVRSQPTPAEGLARRFCLALAQETAGMQPGTWRMVDIIAHRLGVPLEEASAVADDCARRRWVDHESHSIRLREAGRRVAVGVRKAIVSKQQSAEAKLSTTNWARESAQRDRQQMTDFEKLQHEIYLLGEIINSNAAALKSKTMSDETGRPLSGKSPCAPRTGACSCGGSIVFQGSLGTTFARLRRLDGKLVVWGCSQHIAAP
jgi:hypothetical protein